MLIINIVDQLWIFTTFLHKCFLSIVLSGSIWAKGFLILICLESICLQGDSPHTVQLLNHISESKSFHPARRWIQHGEWRRRIFYVFEGKKVWKNGEMENKKRSHLIIILSYWWRYEEIVKTDDEDKYLKKLCV